MFQLMPELPTKCSKCEAHEEKQKKIRSHIAEARRAILDLGDTYYGRRKALERMSDILDIIEDKEKEESQ